jgi:coenzyme F420-reducing hydrogenase beta subunit
MIAIKPEVCGICGACVAICRQNALFLFNATLQVAADVMAAMSVSIFARSAPSSLSQRN